MDFLNFLQCDLLIVAMREQWECKFLGWSLMFCIFSLVNHISLAWDLRTFTKNPPYLIVSAGNNILTEKSQVSILPKYISRFPDDNAIPGNNEWFPNLSYLLLNRDTAVVFSELPTHVS